ncbi:MAG TPA: RES family NAD+ phosphorylase [Edaphocola sp.]|nr:RES family NAD+ phosphorylase [Edaphocola sp.]
MLVYNIRKEQFSKELSASGAANRWNKSDEWVIYGAGSAALAALELLVHRAGIREELNYKLLIIEIKATTPDIKTVDLDQLPIDWKSIYSYPILQNIGSEWYHKQKNLLMKIPSAVLPREFNYVINTKHPSFKSKVKIKQIEDFIWDSRLLF